MQSTTRPSTTFGRKQVSYAKKLAHFLKDPAQSYDIRNFLLMANFTAIFIDADDPASVHCGAHIKAHECEGYQVPEHFCLNTRGHPGCDEHGDMPQYQDSPTFKGWVEFAESTLGDGFMATRAAMDKLTEYSNAPLQPEVDPFCTGMTRSRPTFNPNPSEDQIQLREERSCELAAALLTCSRTELQARQANLFRAAPDAPSPLRTSPLTATPSSEPNSDHTPRDADTDFATVSPTSVPPLQDQDDSRIISTAPPASKGNSLPPPPQETLATPAQTPSPLLSDSIDSPDSSSPSVANLTTEEEEKAEYQAEETKSEENISPQHLEHPELLPNQKTPSRRLRLGTPKNVSFSTNRAGGTRRVQSSSPVDTPQVTGSSNRNRGLTAHTVTGVRRIHINRRANMVDTRSSPMSTDTIAQQLVSIQHTIDQHMHEQRNAAQQQAQSLRDAEAARASANMDFEARFNLMMAAQEKITATQSKFARDSNARAAQLEAKQRELEQKTEAKHAELSNKTDEILSRLDDQRNDLRSNLNDSAQSQLDALARTVEALSLDPRRTCSYSGKLVTQHTHRDTCGTVPLSFWAVPAYLSLCPDDLASEASTLTVTEKAFNENSSITTVDATQEKLLQVALSKSIIKSITNSLDDFIEALSTLARFIKEVMKPQLLVSGLSTAPLREFLTDQFTAVNELREYLNTSFRMRYASIKWTDALGGKALIKQVIIEPLRRSLRSLGTPFSGSYAAFRSCCELITIADRLNRREITDAPVIDISKFETKVDSCEKRMAKVEEKLAKPADNNALLTQMDAKTRDLESKIVSNVQKAATVGYARINSALTAVNAPAIEAPVIKGGNSDANSSRANARSQNRRDGAKRRREESANNRSDGSQEEASKQKPKGNAAAKVTSAPAGDGDDEAS